MMVEIGIVPTAKGYAAVGLPKTLGKTDNLIIRAPFRVSEDLKTRILGRLHREVAEYLWEVGKWEGIGLAVFLWAIAEAMVLYVCIGTLVGYGMKFAILYGWVRFWFLSSGLLLFFPYLAKVLHRRRAKKIREYHEGGRYVGSWIECQWPKAENLGGPDEEEYIAEMMATYPKLRPYYEQILRVDPPEAMDLYPFTILGRIRNWIFGPPLRLPRMVYYVGVEA